MPEHQHLLKSISYSKYYSLYILDIALTNLMSSSFISRVISAFAFCTASSLAPEDKNMYYNPKRFLYMKPTE